MTKKTLGLVVIMMALCLGIYVLTANASTVTGDLNTGLNSNNGNMDGIVVAAPTPSPAVGTYTSTQSVTLTASGSTAICYTVDGTTPGCTNATTCSAGTLYSGAISVTSSKTVKSLACYSNNSAGPVASSAYTINISSGGGGGGGGSTTYCSAVTYADWGASCFGNIQTRAALTQTPSGCTLTTDQQATMQRTCPAAATSTPPVATSTPPTTTTPPTSNVLTNIASEAGILNTQDTNQLLDHLNQDVSLAAEQAGLIKYKTILGLDKTLTANEKSTINDFIIYGTATTQRLGAGERAAVINSYYQAYNRLPDTEAEWSDVLKIASGRWPTERSATAENQAKLEFVKVYRRQANLSNNIDQNAIMVIAYGLLPLNRNLNSERVAIKTFEYVYGHAPVNALAWNVVRAIAYSGAKRQLKSKLK